MTEQHTCPRRIEDGRADPNSPFVGSGTNLDTWRPATTGPSCSYCGSLHPDRFMELTREGWIVGPTDKSYKAYLARPLTDEELAQRKERWLAGFTLDEAMAAAKKRGETLDQFRDGLSEYYDRHLASEASGAQEKFYFQHLSAEQRDEFIDLYNSKRMRVGSPGHFYQPPFFARPAGA